MNSDTLRLELERRRVELADMTRQYAEVRQTGDQGKIDEAWAAKERAESDVRRAETDLELQLKSEAWEAEEEARRERARISGELKATIAEGDARTFVDAIRPRIERLIELARTQSDELRAIGDAIMRQRETCLRAERLAESIGYTGQLPAAVSVPWVARLIRVAIARTENVRHDLGDWINGEPKPAFNDQVARREWRETEMFLRKAS